MSMVCKWSLNTDLHNIKQHDNNIILADDVLQANEKKKQDAIWRSTKKKGHFY